MDKIILAYGEFVIHVQGLLPASANVDMILFLLSVKTCMRTKIKGSRENLHLLEKWCAQFHYSFGVDDEDFVYIAINDALLEQIMKVDHSSQAHENQLGKLLGYPQCCYEKIAEIGEIEIDDYEKRLTNQIFAGPFRLINPINYEHGKAFISHVPCSTKCFDSLIQAQQLARFLIKHKNQKLFKPWLEQLEKIHQGQP